MPFMQDEINHMRANGVTGLTDAPVSDRQRIEDAFKVLNVPIADGERRVATSVLMWAAGRYLETLPKLVTKYQVTRRYGLKRPPSCFTKNQFDTIDEAVLDALRGHPLESFPDRIEIEKVEVSS